MNRNEWVYCGLMVIPIEQNLPEYVENKAVNTRVYLQRVVQRTGEPAYLAVERGDRRVGFVVEQDTFIQKTNDDGPEDWAIFVDDIGVSFFNFRSRELLAKPTKFSSVDEQYEMLAILAETIPHIPLKKEKEKFVPVGLRLTARCKQRIKNGDFIDG